jgi:hypothetical protein
VKLQSCLLYPLRDELKGLFCAGLVPSEHHKVSRPGESHPQALSEPYVRLSPHTAPIMQPSTLCPTSSVQRVRVPDARSSLTNE